MNEFVSRTALLLCVLVFSQTVFAKKSRVIIETLEHRLQETSKIHIAEERIVPQTEIAEPILLSEIIAIRFLHADSDKSVRISREQNGIRLENDDWLVASVNRIADGRLAVTPSRGVSQTDANIPLEMVRYACVNMPHDAHSYGRLLTQLEVRRPGGDAIWNMEGNRISGTLKAFNDQQGVLQMGDVESSVPRASIRALSIDPDLIFFQAPQKPRFTLRFFDGSHLTGTDLQMSDVTGQLTLDIGAELKFSVTALREIRPVSGRVTCLSDIKPTAFKMQPYFSVEKSWQKNRTVGDRPMRVQGQPVPKGIGVTSQSDLKYTLDKQYQTFQSLLAMDDISAGDGHVTYSVLIDGQAVQQGDLSGDSKPIRIGPHDVSDADTLRLIVGFGRRGDILDNVNWCYPLLVKKP